ncbi:hypothetical protein M9Y10_042726 [Tritrichomonas musculus]|uniref:Uncharacterized protein n=1 Tax=Tritrichomonas musculus TaxID=1915356 RepID=A0ABR2JXN5_9EUKA
MNSDPIIRIIDYLFQKNGKYLVTKDITSFFANGIDFPSLVAIAFNIEEVPGIIHNPANNFENQVNNNNYHAYKYMIDNNSKIFDLLSRNQQFEDIFTPNYNFHTFKDDSHSGNCSRNNDLFEIPDDIANFLLISNYQSVQQKPSFENVIFKYNYSDEKSMYKLILSLLLTEQCFNINIQDIKTKCNIIVKPLKIVFRKEKDLISIKCLLSLLNVFTNGAVVIDTEMNDFNTILVESFKKAKAPLVIDKNSFDNENQYLFLIQIEILFDFFNNKNEEKMQIKTKKNRSSFSILYRNADQAVLETINAIGKNHHLHFDDFIQTIEYDNISNFLLVLFNKNQTHLQSLKNLISDSSNNISTIIQFLQKIEPKFETLIFDFENPEYIESSASILYTNILDFFFLNKSKEELYDRCYTLLYSKYKVGDQQYIKYDDIHRVLCSWNTYEVLISFINNQNLKIELEKKSLNSVYGDSSCKIPIVINKEYLKLYHPSIIPNAAFYQLQFIFDALDSSNLGHRIIENFLISIRKLTQINVPQYNEIAQIIRTINVSKILQNKRYDQNLKHQNRNNENNDQKSKNKNCYQPQLLESYAYRIKFSLLNKKQSSIKTYKKKLINDDNEYKDIFNNYIFENGILYKNTKNQFLSFDLFNKKERKSSLKPNIEKIIKSENGIDYVSLKSQKPIFKLFYYNEKKNKWIFNEKDFKLFANNDFFYYTSRLPPQYIDENDYFALNNCPYAEKNKEKHLVESPIVFILNSNLKLSLNFLKCINHWENQDFVLFDEDICIFGIADKDINGLRSDDAPLKYDIDNEKTKPLFMFLYVPEDKQKLPYIRKIIFQIEFFLYIISNIIIVLNDELSFAQNDFIDKKLIALKNTYKINEQFVLNINESLFYDDDDEEQYDLGDFFYVNEAKSILLNKISKYLIITNDDICNFPFKSRHIFSLSSSSDQSESKYAYKIFNLLSHDQSTYDNFIKILLNNISFIISQRFTSHMKEKFELIRFFHMDNFYVKYRIEEENVSLNERITHIFSKAIIENNNLKEIMSILAKLQKEIFQSFPLLDYKYFEECNNVFDELKEKILLDEKPIFIHELKLSSDRHLKYLSDLIKSRPYWTNEQLNDFFGNHFNFLKKEFLSIIHDYHKPNQSSLVYSKNKSILDDQISDARIKLSQLLNEAKLNQKQDIIRKVDFKNETNYTIRERENEREIKARIEKKGKLEDLIPQDF